VGVQTTFPFQSADWLVDYVLQRALIVAEGEQKEVLIGKVAPLVASMRRYSSAYTKHLTSSTLSVFAAFAELTCATS
jgi:hypothetical protein